MTQGECNCGQVAFEMHHERPDIYYCHCSICRRSTGANGIAVLVVRKEDFCWKRGEHLISSWKKPGHDWQTWFCSQCGSRLPGENDPSHMFVPAGLLNGDNSQLRVTHHIWVDSRASWDVIGGDGRQHPEAFVR